MKQRWDAWVELMSRKEPATVLALLRIGVGLVILYSLLSIARADLVEALWVDSDHGGMRRLQPGGLVGWLGGATPSVIWTLWWISLVGALAMVAGAFGRVPLAIATFVYQPMVTVNDEAYGGYEQLIAQATFLLLLAGCTSTLSVDCWRRHGRWTDDTPMPAWPRYILLFQLLLVYSATGLQKLSADWVPGGGSRALYWVAQDPTWNRYDLRTFAAEWLPLTRIATFGTWIFEVTGVLLLVVFYYRATADRPGRVRAALNRWDLRRPWALTGIGLHLGILLMLDVGPFSPISLCYYLTLWTPAEVERALARLRRLRPGA